MSRVGRMSWLRVDHYLAESALPTLLIPVSPVEEHGPHLPIGTDYLLTEEVAWEVARRTNSVVFPTIPLMCCGISRDATGTIPIEGETLRLITRDLVNQGLQKGFKRIVFLSIHFGYSIEVMRTAIDELTSHEQAVVAVVPFNEVTTLPQGCPPFDLHAGWIETSGMLFRHPSLVGQLPAEDHHNEVDGVKVLSRSGVDGNPQLATAELGTIVFKATVEGVVRWLDKHKPQD